MCKYFTKKIIEISDKEKNIAHTIFIEPNKNVGGKLYETL